MQHAILDTLNAGRATGRKHLAVLLDPDKVSAAEAAVRAELAAAAGADWLMVGGSLVMDDSIHTLVAALKAASDLPVVLFPGSTYQIVPEADAILFLSLISGRNPDLLIGRQVEAAPLLAATRLEVLPTGYMLVDPGHPTTVQYVSNTQPLPRDKPGLAACTALAGELLGLRLFYLDGGSGAREPVPPAVIEAVRAHIRGPLMVGGGIRTGATAAAAWAAGADLLVVGTATEGADHRARLQQIGAAKAAANRLVPER